MNYWCWTCLLRVRDIPSRTSRINLIDDSATVDDSSTVWDGKDNIFHPKIVDLIDDSNTVWKGKDKVVVWKEIKGERIPFCPFCDISLINQERWSRIKRWIKYSVIGFLVLLGTQIVRMILNRDFLFIE